MLAFPEGKFPKYVYLHAGTAKGAKALGVTSATIVKNGYVCKNVFVAICSAFNLLSEAEIEDFLCVYSAYLCQDQSKIQKIEARKKRFCNNPKRQPVCL
jgi:hypothetical protein